MLTEEEINARARELRDAFFEEVKADRPDDPIDFDSSWLTGDHLAAISGIALANGMKLEARVEELEREVAELRR
jgi:hypothetical protein